jgi:ABC-2 type transport system permease protein
MEAKIPSTSTALTALLKTDFTTQWRNRRSVILVLLVPVIILISWKPVAAKLGGPFVLASCITIGLTAIGLMGYANAVARDRDKGVFQRLRIAPIQTWTIMISRLCVQLFMIVLITTLVFFVGSNQDHIELTASGYAISYFTAIIGGAVYLGLGQMIVGLLKNAETVNSTSRLVYFVFIMVGMFGDLGLLGKQMKSVVHWSPYGTVKTILAAGMNPQSWNTDASMALLISVVYALIFSVLGIKWFRWNVK